MGLFNQFISLDIKNNMGIAGLTDEFFCVYLHNLFEKYNKNILVVVNSLYEANQLYSSLKNYSDNITNKFDLSIEEVDKLDKFFNESYIVVMKELMEHYKISVDGKRNGDKFEFNINIPVVTTSKTLSPNQIEYLTTKYYETFEELSLSDLGINAIKIIEKYWPTNRLSNEIKYDENKHGFSYIMKVSCSVKNLYFISEYYNCLRRSSLTWALSFLMFILTSVSRYLRATVWVPLVSFTVTGLDHPAAFQSFFPL